MLYNALKMYLLYVVYYLNVLSFLQHYSSHFVYHVCVFIVFYLYLHNWTPSENTFM